MSLEELFCHVDDFCKAYDEYLKPHLLGEPNRRGPKCRLSRSEVMTIMIEFHRSRYRDFKTYYLEHVRKHLKAEFPSLVSYSRFVELIPASLVPLVIYLKTRFGQCTGISFVDSTPIPVCHNKRIKRNKVFEESAKRGKGSMGWFYGFKLHLVVNEYGELLGVRLTAGNVDDRKPIPQFAATLFGKLFADRGYISKDLFKQLYDDGLQLITPIRSNMNNKLMPLFDKILLRKRSIIETINDQLKNLSQIVHTRHRSATNFAVNLIAGLIAYTHQPKKPSLNLHPDERMALPVAI